jgi:hypothetical protein
MLYKKDGKPLCVLKLYRIEALCEECTHGELEDRVYFKPSFLTFGKAGGLQILSCRGLQ